MNGFRQIGGMVAIAVSSSIWAAEAKYPVRPIRVLIPFPAGGVADTIGRTLGEQLTAQTGQPCVIDNRPGAGGRIAAELLAKSEPDGYTLFVSTAGPLVISPALLKNLPYDSERDFLPVTRVAEAINVMVVNPSSGVRNVREFIDWAKKRPGSIRFGSSGVGQPDHLSAEFFQRLSGLQMIHVPYKGGGPALVDLVANDIQLMFATYAVAVPHVKGGRLRALAVTTPQRQPLLPDLPAMAESLPGFGVSNWNGIFIPARTPAAVADRLFGEFNRALKVQSVRERQNAAGIEPAGSASRHEFVQFVRSDAERWRKIISDANVKVE